MKNSKLIPLSLYGINRLKVGDRVLCTSNGNEHLHYHIIAVDRGRILADFGGLYPKEQYFIDFRPYKHYLDLRPYEERNAVTVKAAVGVLALSIIVLALFLTYNR